MHEDSNCGHIFVVPRDTISVRTYCHTYVREFKVREGNLREGTVRRVG